MRLLEAAGLPPGVINMVTGHGADVSEVALADPDAGRHPLHRLDARRSSTCGGRSAANIGTYRSYPRIVGETGGKDFVVAHPSRRRRRRCGPRWSAARSSTRARSARRRRARTCRGRCGRGCATSLVADDRGAARSATSTDFVNFLGAVIDRRAFDKLAAAHRPGAADPDVHRGRRRDGTTTPRATSSGRPSSVAPTRPTRVLPHRVLRADPGRARLRRRPTSSGVLRQTGAGLAVRADRLDHRPRPGGDRPRARTRCGSPPATSTSTTSRPAPWSASSRSAAPARPGTNDKAGSPQNLMRWTSPRSIKETFVPPTDHRYPHLG